MGPMTCGCRAVKRVYAVDPIEIKLADFIDIREIPTLPKVAEMAISKTLSIDTSAEEMASIIRENPSLTLKILKIANSPMYTMGARISNIKDAVILLGYKTIKSLVLSITVQNIFAEDKNKWFDYRGFWLHSIASAVISEEISKELNTGKTDSEMNAYTAGLLHDIGKTILLISDAPTYKKVTDLVRELKVTFMEAEQQVFGFDHSDVSAFLFEYWELSDNLITPVRNHHRSGEYLTQKPDSTTSIVALANEIAHISGFNTLPDEAPYEVSKELISMLGLDQPSMDRILTDSREYLETFAEALNIPKTDIKGYFELLSAANRELGGMYLENHRKSEEITRKSSLCVELNKVSRFCLHEKNLVTATKMSLRSFMIYFRFPNAWLELYLNKEKSILCTSRKPQLFGEDLNNGSDGEFEEQEKTIGRAEMSLQKGYALFPIVANGEEEIGRIAVQNLEKSDRKEVLSFIDHLALGLNNVRLHFTNRVKTENLNIAVKQLKEEHGRRQGLRKLNDLILDTTPIGMLTTTKKGSIIQYNREAEHMLGESLKEKNLFTLKLFKDEDLGSRLGDIGQKRQRADLTMQHKGIQHHLLIESVPIEGTEQILLLVTDMSERIEEEKILIQKEKMATLGEFSAGVAHNLRSLLAVGKGVPELILSDVEKGNVKITRKVEGKQAQDKETEDNLRLISQSTEKALSIIESIMEFAKKEPGQFENIELKNVIDEVYTLIESKLKGKKITFSNKVGACTLFADRNMITQIFINLFNNAINAVKDKGAIEVSCKKEKGRTIIHFMDDGKGVDKAILDQIFEPFFTTSGRANGTGIGLSITRKMVTLHGGSIKALPRSGGGTIIEIIFPERKA
jgi:signal transduction histidine kinase/HD-like signal output (HDOD) protein